VDEWKPLPLMTERVASGAAGSTCSFTVTLALLAYFTLSVGSLRTSNRPRSDKPARLCFSVNAQTHARSI